MKKILAITFTCLISFQSFAFANIPRVKITALKNNMSIVQGTLDNYASNSSGAFPEDINDLITEAKNGSYWKPIKNPFNNHEGVGKNGSIINYRDYNQKAKMGGLVLYQTSGCTNDPATSKANCTSYKLFCTDSDGKLVEFQGTPYSLSNN